MPAHDVFLFWFFTMPVRMVPTGTLKSQNPVPVPAT